VCRRRHPDFCLGLIDRLGQTDGEFARYPKIKDSITARAARLGSRGFVENGDRLSMLIVADNDPAYGL